MRTLHVLVVGCLATVAFGDYACLCTYDIETSMYESPSAGAHVVDYMYEFDCRATYPVDGLDPKYSAIGFEHKLVYILMTPQTMVQTCQGSIPDTDKVPPVQHSTHGHTHHVKTTTTAPTTTSVTATTPKPTTTTTQLPTTTVLTTTTTKPTTTMKSPPTTSPTTSMPTTSTSAPTTKPTTATTTRTMTTISSPTTHQLSTTHSPLFSCPLSPSQHAQSGYLFSGDGQCYEYVANQSTWLVAKLDCESKGGTLLTIKDEATQAYIIKQLLRWPSVQKFEPFWIGLHDRFNEELWTWVDDNSNTTYTNWMPGRFIDTYHDQEDCALFVYQRNGEWDDVVCDQETRAWICQYCRNLGLLLFTDSSLVPPLSIIYLLWTPDVHTGHHLFTNCSILTLGLPVCY